MPGTEELMARLQRLEDGYFGDKEQARQQKFFDMYGGSFSNDHSLGMAILNELDARGIDTSAADEAVQSIIDQLRTECNEIMSLISNVQDKAVEAQEKIDTIKDVVDNKVASNPEASVSPGSELSADMGNPDMGNPDMGGEPPMPAGPEAGSEPPADIGNPDMGGEPSMPAGPEAGSEPPVAPMVPSDARIKNIRSAYDRIQARRNSIKPSAGIIQAALGGRD